MSDATCNRRCSRCGLYDCGVKKCECSTVLVWSPRTPWSPRYVDADSATVRTHADYREEWRP